MSFYHLEKFLRKKVGNLLFNFRMNIVGPPVYVGLNIYCWLKDKDNTSHWLRNIYGNLDYTQESEIYTEIMSVYGNLDYIRESGISIRKLWVFTEIWIIYENQEYIRKLWLFTEIRSLTEIRSINGNFSQLVKTFNLCISTLYIGGSGSHQIFSWLITNL